MFSLKNAVFGLLLVICYEMRAHIMGSYAAHWSLLTKSDPWRSENALHKTSLVKEFGISRPAHGATRWQVLGGAVVSVFVTRL